MRVRAPASRFTLDRLVRIAEVLGWYFAHDSDYRVVAHTVDGAYLTESTFQGVPVVPFEELPRAFPPEDHMMFVALSYAKMNAIRAAKYAAVWSNFCTV